MKRGGVILCALLVAASAWAIPAPAFAAPVVMDYLTPAGDAAAHGARDTDGTGYYLPVGYGDLLKVKKSDCYDMTLSSAGNAQSVWGALEVHLNYSSAFYMTASDCLAAAGAVKTTLLFQQMSVQASENTQVWFARDTGAAGLAQVTVNGVAYELRPSITNTPNNYGSYTLQNAFERSFGSANHHLGVRSLVVIVSDRRAGGAKCYYRIFHEGIAAGGSLDGYKGGNILSGVTSIAATLYVPQGMNAVNIGGGATTLQGTQIGGQAVGIVSSTSSTSTVLADAIIAKAAPANLNEWKSAGEDWLQRPISSAAAPATPDITGNDSADASATAGAVADLDMPWLLDWLWDKVLGWLNGLGDFFWFVPFFSELTGA